MSTMAGTSLQGALAISRDLYQKTFWRTMSDEKVLTLSKLVNIAVIVFSAVPAYLRLANIAEIFMIGAAASCAAFVPILFCGLYWKRETAAKIMYMEVNFSYSMRLWSWT